VGRRRRLRTHMRRWSLADARHAFSLPSLSATSSLPSCSSSRAVTIHARDGASSFSSITDALMTGRQVEVEVDRPSLLTRGANRSAVSPLGSANLVRPRRCLNGPSDSASRHRHPGKRARPGKSIARQSVGRAGGKQTAQGWAGEKGDRRDSALRPSQGAGKGYPPRARRK